MIEEEQDTELEEVERRKLLLADAVSTPDPRHTSSQSPRTQPGTGSTGTSGSGSGGWHESESCLFWDPSGDTSVLESSSSDGLAAMQAARQQAAALAGTGTGTASQDDDENYTKGDYRE